VGFNMSAQDGQKWERSFIRNQHVSHLYNQRSIIYNMELENSILPDR